MPAASATVLTVMVFPGTQTLPVFAAQANGFFDRRGLAVDLKAAPNSEEQRNGLAAGRYQIVHGAADQAVALVAAGIDAVVIAGGDNGFNHLFVQPEIASLAELRGRTLVADVANTGWSFVLYEMLRRHGLARAEYAVKEVGAPFRRFEAMRDDPAMAAAILNPPFAIHARRAGLKGMGTVVDTIGAYQGTVPYVLRSFAQQHSDTLTAYLAACIEGLRWSLDPRHAAMATKLLGERLKLPDDIAVETYAAASDPHQGLARDAALDLAGFNTMLELRARFDGSAPAAAERYFDLTCHARALAELA